MDNIVETAWLKYESVLSLSDAITDVTESCEKGKCWFQMKTVDSSRINMDCLDVFEHKSDKDYLYGIYHTFDHDVSDFVTYLARAKKNSGSWKIVTKLEIHSSQAKIWLSPNSDDILFAYEASPVYDGNHIEIIQYSSLEDIKINRKKE